MADLEKSIRAIRIKPREEVLPGTTPDEADRVLDEVVRGAIKRTEPLVLTRFDLAPSASNADVV